MEIEQQHEAAKGKCSKVLSWRLRRSLHDINLMHLLLSSFLSLVLGAVKMQLARGFSWLVVSFCGFLFAMEGRRSSELAPSPLPSLVQSSLFIHTIKYKSNLYHLVAIHCSWKPRLASCNVDFHTMNDSANSSALIPSSASLNFAQQGSLDWVALSKSSITFSVEVLGRLSKAGIDPLTVGIGRAICLGIPLKPEVQKRLNDALSRLKSFSSFGNVV